jgi:UDP-galactopyranose mutase
MRYLVVGTGFAGATIAHELAMAGHFVDVIDERDHIGGNAYDYTNEYGIRVHKYGPHLFHTNNKKVFDWITRFGEWVPYKHMVSAQLDDGTLVTLPINKLGKSIIGQDRIVDVIYRPYTRKMWGVELEEIDPHIINRVKTRDDRNKYYFPDDKYQVMPKEGYTRIFDHMLYHHHIKVSLNTQFDRSMEDDYDHVFNSMSIDRYYDYSYGLLEYRSIKFHTVTLPMRKVLPVTTVNFTHDGPYTRMTEWKNIPHHGDNLRYTTLTYEEPCDYTQNDFQRYYPVKDIHGKNKQIYESYKSIENLKTTFIGRCGMYVYIDMHQAINSSLAIAERFK